MKRFAIAVAICALCATSFAGGELPAYRPVVVPATPYVAPAPVGFGTRLGNYGKNVWYGTGNAVCSTVSTATYIVTLGAVDLCEQASYQPTLWNK